VAKGKLMIGYPSSGSVDIDFMNSLITFQKSDFHKWNLMLGGISATGCLLDDNREKIIEGFLDHKPDNPSEYPPEWLVCLDTDIAFKPEIIYGLYEAADPIERPIVTAGYFTWISGQFTICWMRKSPKDNGCVTLTEVKTEVQEIDACGMGCCIIHRSVFEKIKAKYDHDAWTWFGREPAQLLRLNGNRTHLGEDVSFCKRAQSVGAKIWGHGGLQVDHMKKRAENVDTMQERLKLLNYPNLEKRIEELKTKLGDRMGALQAPVPQEPAIGFSSGVVPLPNGESK